jgi:hypothetical protein
MRRRREAPFEPACSVTRDCRPARVRLGGTARPDAGNGRRVSAERCGSAERIMSRKMAISGGGGGNIPKRPPQAPAPSPRPKPPPQAPRAKRPHSIQRAKPARDSELAHERAVFRDSATRLVNECIPRATSATIGATLAVTRFISEQGHLPLAIMRALNPAICALRRSQR